MVNHLEINSDSQNKIDDFNEIMDKSDHTLLIAVHMPGCGWCTKLSKEWKTLKNGNGNVKMNDDITLAWVHIEAMSSLNKLKDNSVNGYPFVIAYRNKQPHIFNDGERSADNLASWANSIVQNGGKKRRNTRRNTRRKRTRRTKRTNKKTKKKRRSNKKRGRK